MAISVSVVTQLPVRATGVEMLHSSMVLAAAAQVLQACRAQVVNQAQVEMVCRQTSPVLRRTSVAAAVAEVKQHPPAQLAVLVAAASVERRIMKTVARVQMEQAAAAAERAPVPEQSVVQVLS